MFRLRKKGENVSQGEIIGEVQETPLIRHKIVVPFGTHGQLSEITEGSYTVSENVAQIKTNSAVIDVGLSNWWMVRKPRPVLNRASTLISTTYRSTCS